MMKSSGPARLPVNGATIRRWPPGGAHAAPLCVALALAAGVLSACGSDGPAGATFTLRDSAGVAIAENGGSFPPGLAAGRSRRSRPSTSAPRRERMPTCSSVSGGPSGSPMAESRW